jgi:hypothetical protein
MPRRLVSRSWLIEPERAGDRHEDTDFAANDKINLQGFLAGGLELFEFQPAAL